MGQKREIILETAAALFRAEGFKATGIDRIIEASGVARMTLYNNFPSKEALILAVLERIGEESATWLTQEVEARHEASGSKIAAMFDAFAASIAEPREPGQPLRGCPFLNISAEFTDDACLIRREAQAFKQRVRGMMAGWLEDDGYDNAEELAANIALVLDGGFATAQMGGPGVTGEGCILRAKTMALTLLKHHQTKAA